MKVSLVYQELMVRGGGQRLLLTQARLLQEHGHDVTVFTPSYSRDVYPELAKSVTLRVLPVRHSRVWAGFPLLSRTLAGLEGITRWVPTELADQDLVIGYTYPSNITAYRAHLEWGIPAMWHCTHPPYGLYPRGPYDKGSTARGRMIQDMTGIPLRIVDKRASKVFSQVLVISSKIGRRVKEIYGLPSVILFPIVDPVDFRIMDLSPENSNCVLYVGRLVWNKGPDLFLRILKGVVSKIPNVKGIMALAGQNTSSLTFAAFKRAIFKMGLQDHVELITGMQSDASDVSQLYARSSIVAYTCRDEDFGLVPLEASVCGRPSVLWDDCGCVQDKILEADKSALVASHYDVDEFVEKVVLLLQTYSLREELASNARVSTLANCHPEVHGKKFEKIINTVASRQ